MGVMSVMVGDGVEEGVGWVLSDPVMGRKRVHLGL